MIIKVITDQEGLLTIKEDWEKLEKQNASMTYYNSFHFNYTWWLTYGKDPNRQLFIICCCDNHRMVGIAPLMIESCKRIIRYKVLKFMGRGDFLNFIIDPGGNNELAIIRQLFAAIEANASQWDQMQLTHIPDQTMLLWYLLKSVNYNPSVTFLSLCPRIELAHYGSFEEYATEWVSAKASKHLIKLQKEVGYRFKVVNNKDDYNVLDAIAETHRMEQHYLNTEKQRSERSSLFDDPEKMEFLTRLYDRNEHVVTFLLETNDGEMITYQTCYLFQDKLHVWNIGYNPKFRQYNLTCVRTIETLNYLMSNSVGYIFDWGAGGYPWKFEWTDKYTVNYLFTKWNPASKRAKLLRVMKFLKRSK